ncbi:unnamed protein product, partial [Cylindrotheca closterium]
SPGLLDADIKAEQAIAQALGKLSLKERERAYEDVHGISQPIDETPKTIADLMQKLMFELASIKSKPAFDIAKQLSEDFVTNHAFLLSFLRAECYDATKAAARMVKYFETKKELFGAEMLTKTITFEDLDSDTQKVVARGSISLLPSRDTLGRYVYVSSPGHHLSGLTTLATLPKAVWYIVSTVAEDEESQLKGFVAITYAVGSQLQDKGGERNKAMWFACVNAGTCIPVRVSGFHHCHSSTKQFSLMLKVVTIAGDSSFNT